MLGFSISSARAGAPLSFDHCGDLVVVWNGTVFWGENENYGPTKSQCLADAQWPFQVTVLCAISDRNPFSSGTQPRRPLYTQDSPCWNFPIPSFLFHTVCWRSSLKPGLACGFPGERSRPVMSTSCYSLGCLLFFCGLRVSMEGAMGEGEVCGHIGAQRSSSTSLAFIEAHRLHSL